MLRESNSGIFELLQRLVILYLKINQYFHQSVLLRCTSKFSVSDLNRIEKDSCSVFGDINILDKDASRQYLYCLSPQLDSVTGLKVKSDSISVGILDIVWRSNLGERGHLQTSTLQTMVRLLTYVELTSFSHCNVSTRINVPFSTACRPGRYSIIGRKTSEYRFPGETVPVGV